MIKLPNYISFILLFVVAIFMLATNPFKSETLAPMDLLLKYPGWQNTPIHPDYIHGERSDVLDARLPIWLSAKHTLRTGEIPFWNFKRAGKPGLIFTNALFTPAFAVFALIKSDALGFYLSNLINVLIGLFGMFFFLRIFFNPPAPSFGAVVFMFSGFNAAWFFWAQVNTAIWTPWVLFTVYQYMHTRNNKYLPLITFTMLMLNLGGFPMVAVMTYMALAIMVFLFILTYKTSIKKHLKMLGMLGMFSLLSVVIAIPFIYPLIELLSWMGGIGYRHGGAGFKLYDFALFINPDFYRSARVETTFYVGILPLILLAISVPLFIKKPKFIALFGLLLFVYSITIAFTLISPELIHKIPTLNSSLLTRFGYLIGLSLAIISAYSVDSLLKRTHNKTWVYIIIIALFSIQILDQKSLFKRFNGPVPNEAFYPQTKTISYLQETLKPFQYIIADQGFLIGGTLGGYGLNDWFAHNFHTEQERQILGKVVKDPFGTPTSAIFPFSDINLSSPYIDLLNIKSILATSFSNYTYINLWDTSGKQAPAPIMPTNTLMQKFHIDKPYIINGIALIVATYGTKHASSDVQLTLKSNNKTIASSIVKKESITDNKTVTFKFEELLTLQKGSYSIDITMLDTSNATALTVWTNTNTIHNKMYVNGSERNSSIKMFLTQKKVLNKKYKIYNLEPHIYMIENLNVSGAAYFLKTLNVNEALNQAPVETTIQSNTKIELDYSGEEDGWVVLPMRSYPGWIATINGEEIQTEKFLGMLPAIHVKGKSKIIISYNPIYNKYTYPLAMIGLLLLLLSMLIFRKKGKQ